MSNSWQYRLGYLSGRWRQIRQRLNLSYARGYLAGICDRAKYEIFRRLWNVWHCRLPRFRFFMKRVETIGLARDRHGQLYNPIRYERRHWITCCGDSRPWWHLCCNGDAGGWRTGLCDYLEHKWRGTNYYNRD